MARGGPGVQLVTELGVTIKLGSGQGLKWVAGGVWSILRNVWGLNKAGLGRRMHGDGGAGL